MRPRADLLTRRASLRNQTWPQNIPERRANISGALVTGSIGTRQQRWPPPDILQTRGRLHGLRSGCRFATVPWAARPRTAGSVDGVKTMKVALVSSILLAGISLGGSGLFVVKHGVDAASAERYLSARECPIPAAASGCFVITKAEVMAKSAAGDESAALTLNIAGVGERLERLVSSDGQSVYDAVDHGSTVSVKVWQGNVTLVIVGDLITDTDHNPTLAAVQDLVVAIVLAVFGVLMLIQGVLVYRAARRMARPQAPDDELDRLSGPFGEARTDAIEVRRVYPLRGGATTPVLSAYIVFSSVGLALRVQPSFVSASIGAAIGLGVTACALLIVYRSSIVVGPDGITLRRPWGQRRLPGRM